MHTVISLFCSLGLTPLYGFVAWCVAPIVYVSQCGRAHSLVRWKRQLLLSPPSWLTRHRVLKSCHKLSKVLIFTSKLKFGLGRQSVGKSLAAWVGLWDPQVEGRTASKCAMVCVCTVAPCVHNADSKVIYLKAYAQGSCCLCLTCSGITGTRRCKGLKTDKINSFRSLSVEWKCRLKRERTLAQECFSADDTGWAWGHVLCSIPWRISKSL